MHASLADRALFLEFGTCFGTAEVARVIETFDAFAPLEHLRLDFSSVHSWEESAFAVLVRALAARPTTRVLIRGLDDRRRSVLERILGAGPDAPSAGAPDAEPDAPRSGVTPRIHWRWTGRGS